MKPIKVAKDWAAKLLLGRASVPRGLFEINQYFRQNGPISFSFHNEDGVIVATSDNFRYGSIVTQGRDHQELDKNIKDAILTTFEVPSAYATEAQVKSLNEQKQYALA